MIYESAWWSLEYPDGWEADQDEYCTSLYDPEGSGALQVSAARNDTRPVTDEDLMDHVSARVREGAEMSRSANSFMTGFTTTLAREHNVWQEWWLRSASLVVYVTYICPVEDLGREREAVNAIIESIRPRTTESALT